MTFMTQRINVLVIDDEEVMRDSCQQALTRQGHSVETSENGRAGLKKIGKKVFDLVILDLKMPGIPGLEVLKRIKETSPETIVLIITGHATVASAVEAMKLGAYDFLPKPFTPEEMNSILKRALEKKKLLAENAALREQLDGGRTGEIVVGPNRAMRRMYNLLWKVAPTDSTVLITGESGTGKELVAKAVHRNSERKGGPFITVDCGSVVSTLFESEIFGHVKGAFTDAVANKQGKLELAQGGTIFFDEIGNINLQSQAKLLRAIQEREISRVGDAKVVKIDVRIVAATNADLRKAVQDGKFREDLYYRINVVNVELPPLRERKDDIPPLVSHFIAKYNKSRKRAVASASEKAMELMTDYSWPGNIRELENVIERAVILCDGRTIQPWDLPLREASLAAVTESEGTAAGTLDEVEKQHIARALRKFHGHRIKTAQSLGIDRKTLRTKMKAYGLPEPTG